MWDLEPHEKYAKRCKKWIKRHNQEFVRVHERLNKVLASLNAGANPLKLPFGFLHPEPRGVLAIDQGDSNLKETRLYIYAHAEKKHLHIFAIGDKDSQTDDIAYSTGAVGEILGQKIAQLQHNESEEG